MKKGLILFITGAATIAAEAALTSLLPYTFAIPNLLIILTVSMGFMRGSRTGMWLGFVCGLVRDIAYGGIPGVNALIMMYIGYCSGFLYMRFFEDNILVPVIAVGTGDFIYNVIFFVINVISGGKIDFASCLVNIILPEVISSILFAVPLYGLYYLAARSMTSSELEDEHSPWLRR